MTSRGSCGHSPVDVRRPFGFISNASRRLRAGQKAPPTLHNRSVPLYIISLYVFVGHRPWVRDSFSDWRKPPSVRQKALPSEVVRETAERDPSAGLGGIVHRLGVRAGSMAAGLLSGLGSERRLARSVAQRLKYYIEVQRKEISFQSSGLTWDEAENFHLHPAYLTEQRTKEHNFANIKLEAFLRTYVGNAEECNRKVQGNMAKQKEVEKLIKKMARDYVPDRINKAKTKSRPRQNKMSCSLSKLYLNAVPPLSLEEVKRLVSSASKLIVAATSKMSPEEMEKTQDHKRRETKRVKSFSDGRKKDFSTILFHENEPRRGQQTRQSDQEIKRKAKASNASSTTPAKSKRIFSVAAWDTQQKTCLPSLKGTDKVGMHSYAPFKIRRQESSSKPGEEVSGKNCPPRKPSAAGPSQTLGSKAHKDRPQRSDALKAREQKASKGNCACPSSRSTAEICSSQRPTTGKKIRKQFSSEAISRSSILKKVSDPKPHPDDPGGKLVKCTQRNGPKSEGEGSDSLPRTVSKCHQVNFANRESLGLERDRARGSRDDGDSDAAAASTEKRGLAEGHNGDGVSTARQGPPFLHELGQEMTREVPSDRTRREPNQSFSPKEPRAGENRAEGSPSQERVLDSESCKPGAICIPPTAPAGCRCSELPSYCVCKIREGQEIGFPGETAALLQSLDGEQSDGEFTHSSLSSSAGSSGWLCEQMGENVTLKEGFGPKMETFLQKLLKAPENCTVPQEASHQYEKQK